MYLIFDTETTGLPKDFKAPITDTDNWPRCIQIAWQLHDDMGKLIENKDFLIKPDGFDIPFDSEKIHGISTQLAEEKGVPIQKVLEEFNAALKKSKFVVGQNIDFDVNIMGCEFYRYEVSSSMMDLPALDTCTEKTANLCQIPGGRGGKFKLPTLTELHQYLFGEAFQEAHNATADVEATTRCFLELVRREQFTPEELLVEQEYFARFKEINTQEIALVGLKHLNLKAESASLKKESGEETPSISREEEQQNLQKLSDVKFSHLHNHTQFTILEATTRIDNLVKKAVEMGMPGVAMTDTGNMMGAFNFVKAVHTYNKSLAAEDQEEKGLTPIVGCEFYVCEDHQNKSVKDNGSQVVLLAKNKKGYHNLCKLSSYSFTQGFYYVPRIDKKLIEEYKGDLICLTGNLNGEVPYKILNVGEKQAEEAFLWWKEQFGDDFYAALMRHDLEEEERVNQTLLKFCENHGVKYVATNNTFYLHKEDSKPHDILLCVKEGAKQSDPIGRGRGFRKGLPNDGFYFKSQEEMKQAFADLPMAIQTTQEIVDKCEPYVLERDVLLPKYDIPEQFIDPEDEKDNGNRGENAFLRHLTYEGAKGRYGEVTPEISERLDFELETIERTGYPGYFLIVQDFCNKAREMGVAVGPGRGSAAGSAVAYCIGITNVDPIKYDLLFERFLNPDRVSMPDIDIDFDDDGRQKVIDYVIDKYGANQVAQIITYGTMAAKSSIRDTARVLDLPLADADRIAKLVPDIKLAKLFGLSEQDLKEKLNSDDFEKARQMLEISGQTNLDAQVVNQAKELEGSMRNTGIHACGVIITPSDITNYVPVATAKDSDLCCTQFDNAVVESAGMLKMDFLGLKTLTLIRDAIRIIKDRHGIEIFPDDIPLEDEKTYELFQRGDTVGIFQFESPGMQKHLKSLKPDKFGDLIAMNALYRPGPLEYIPNFIARKHGDEDISYDAPEMEEYLAETYGITVYQEQVMLLSQKLAGFTKGMADALRKGMGKKKKEIIDELKPKFIDGCAKNNIAAEVAEKIWKDWEAFAAYAFNKSHSTCYSVVAFHTAYLKAHYPAEYMASVLSNNLNDIKQVTFFMDECRRMGIEVLGPDVNESVYEFTVNKEGAIRFGLGAIKGVGSNPVNAIMNERKENGPFESFFDFVRRIDLKACNKKVFESLALGGSFDSFKEIHRAQYFSLDQKERTFIENAIKYGNNFQESKNSSQVSLFGEASEVQMPAPTIPECNEWSNLVRLKKEKEVIGIFISGHPLDDYKLEINHLCNASVGEMGQLEKWENKEMVFIAVVNNAEHRTSRKGNAFGRMSIEDYTESADLMLFGDDYLKFKDYLIPEQRYLFKGNVQKRRWGNQELEFKISEIVSAEEARTSMAHEMRLILNAEEVNYGLIDDLHRLFTDNPGDCKLKFRVLSNGDVIDMPSKTMKVAITDEVLESLQNFGLEGVEIG